MSEMYAIKDTTLTALGDAVRNRVIGTTEIPIIECPKTTLTFMGTYSFEFPVYVKKIKIIGKLEHDYTTYHTKLKGLGVAPIKSSSKENVINDKGFVIVVDEVSGYEYGTNYDTDFEIIIDSNVFTFTAPTGENGTPVAYFSFTAIGLDENGNEFKYTPLEMVDKINGLEIPSILPIMLTGQCQYTCANQVASAYVELFGDTISTKDIENSSHMFYYFKGLSIPFEVNMKSGTSQNMSYMFQYASLEELPKINNARPSNVSYMLQNCNYLRNIPEDWMDGWDFTSLNASSGQCGYMFAQCYSLRKIPTSVLKNIWSKSATSTYVPYNNGWSGCYALDELVGIPIQQASLTSNRCTSMVSSCSRLKNLTFEVNEDGSPKTATWKAQTIELTSVGYGAINNITKYNSGITADKLVSDDATYQALKNDPDWFTNDERYSRYNHDSAVTTINSLPDCSATGTNTIKFTGAAGALTDGGAINTLTEEEIAVAAAKGWTVSLV